MEGGEVGLKQAYQATVSPCENPIDGDKELVQTALEPFSCHYLAAFFASPLKKKK